jgi:hypothetical protein
MFGCHRHLIQHAADQRYYASSCRHGSSTGIAPHALTVARPLFPRRRTAASTVPNSGSHHSAGHHPAVLSPAVFVDSSSGTTAQLWRSSSAPSRVPQTGAPTAYGDRAVDRFGRVDDAASSPRSPSEASEDPSGKIPSALLTPQLCSLWTNHSVAPTPHLPVDGHAAPLHSLPRRCRASHHRQRSRLTVLPTSPM